jgi:predicted O-methyltransferase YrrM
MATLEQELERISAQIHANANDLIAYANEDQIGGFHIDETKRLWPMGSLYAEEGQMLYALIRWLKPDSVVQIGGWAGCSATHLAMAVKANGKGHVTSVDNGGDGNTEHGNLLPKELAEYVTLVWANGEDWLANQPDGSIGLMFEDASHATELVAKLSELALKKLQPGGLLVNHDAAHDFAIVGGGQKIASPVGRAVRDGLAMANAYFRIYRAEPSDCGLAITVKPQVTQQFKVPRTAQEDRTTWPPAQLGNANIESVSEPPAPKEQPVKRTRTRKPKV